ncbi:hypothetical protein [Paraclostridium dentum]|uniref:hypothetical protein n=1 Tax=Paraclostridium dentum TaxID=2662455 RepID=UPI003F6799F8
MLVGLSVIHFFHASLSNNGIIFVSGVNNAYPYNFGLLASLPKLYAILNPPILGTLPVFS